MNYEAPHYVISSNLFPFWYNKYYPQQPDLKHPQFISFP
jgi:hypothetical protein